MKLNVLLFLLLSCGPGAVFSQSLVFEGLKRTKAEYLKKIAGPDLQTRDSADIEKTIQIFRNTQLFSDITYRKSVLAGDSVTTLTFSEVRSLLPVAELGITSGNQWFRLGVKDENGAGRGIKTVMYYQYNDKHSFYLRQNFPFMLKSSWGVGYVLRRWSFLEPFRLHGQHQVYVYDNNSAELSFNYPFAVNRHDFEFGFGIMKEKFTHTMPEKDMEAPALITQTKLSFKAVHNIRHMNYKVFYQDGWANTFNALTTYEINLKQPFVSLFNDFRFFRMLPFRTNLAVRNRLGISTNSTVFFAPFVLDSYYNVRGVGNRIDRGTASVVLNAELRKTIWENKTWGVQAVGFSDSGSWRKPGGRLTDISRKENVLVFAGLGSRLIYKKAYDVIFRLDYGWKIHGLGKGFVFGIGQYF
jgi:outer membrane protein insertion porin family